MLFYKLFCGAYATESHCRCYKLYWGPFVSDSFFLFFLKFIFVICKCLFRIFEKSYFWLYMQADGFNAEERVGIPGEHRGILCEPHLFRILKHWLKAGDPDPFYNPLNDYVILPTAFEMERHKEKGLEVASLKEEWEIISKDQDGQTNTGDNKMTLSSISVSQEGANKSHSEAHATVFVHTDNDGKQHIELNAVAVSVDAS